MIPPENEAGSEVKAPGIRGAKKAATKAARTKGSMYREKAQSEKPRLIICIGLKRLRLFSRMEKARREKEKRPQCKTETTRANHGTIPVKKTIHAIASGKKGRKKQYHL